MNAEDRNTADNSFIPNRKFQSLDLRKAFWHLWLICYYCLLHYCIVAVWLWLAPKMQSLKIFSQQTFVHQMIPLHLYLWREISWYLELNWPSETVTQIVCCETKRATTDPRSRMKGSHWGTFTGVGKSFFYSFWKVNLENRSRKMPKHFFLAQLDVPCRKL